MKEFADLKEIVSEKIEELQNKVNQLQKELDSYKKVLIKIDSILEKESFTTAAELYKGESEVLSQKPIPQKPTEPEVNKEFEIKSDNDKILGKMIAEKGTLIIFPTEIITIPESIPPFRNFFLGRILKQMEDEDNEAVKNGKLSKNKVISYEIIKSPKKEIEKIIIKNYRTYNRMIKILDTIGWTFRTILKQKTA
ncbi:MAG: hypothetical protein ACTSRG_02485 [Candidatus Helarchaeota archaeon]